MCGQGLLQEQGTFRGEHGLRPPSRRARVVAARPVFAGDELYASYGPLYWLGADMQGEASARLPEDAVVALLERERVFWDGCVGTVLK